MKIEHLLYVNERYGFLCKTEVERLDNIWWRNYLSNVDLNRTSLDPLVDSYTHQVSKWEVVFRTTAGEKVLSLCVVYSENRGREILEFMNSTELLFV